MRYPIRIDRIWRPVFMLFGATAAASWVELTEDSVRFRCGPVFDQTVPRTEIDSAALIAWSLFGGIGCRIGPGGRAVVVGATSGVVEVRLKTARWMWMPVAIIPWKVRSLAVSLLDPDAFISALRVAP